MPVRLAATIVALAAAGLAASQPQPVFRSGAELVRFDIRVTDSSGRPIADLRPDEIELVDNGQVLKPLLFQHIEEPAGEYGEAALRSVSAQVSSNRGAPRGHLYLLVFDQSHLSPGNGPVVRRAAERFIRQHVRPSDRVALIGLPGPGPSTGFTADHGRALAELAKLGGAQERNVTTAVGDLTVQEAYEIAGGNERVATEVMTRQALQTGSDIGGGSDRGAARLVSRAAERDPEDPAAVRRAILENARTVVAQADATSRDFMLRLADVIEQYRAIEGRKIVVLFSEGFRQTNLTREIEEVEAAAAETYAVFYAFDVNRRVGADGGEAERSPTSASSDIQGRLEPLGSLAAATDGLLVADAVTHLDESLDRIADQAQDYYLIGFAPAAGALASPGQYRPVSVRVSRPGARVSARSGYAVAKPGALDRRAAIDRALAAPFSQQALRVDYTTYTLRSDNPATARVFLALDAELPIRDASHQTADVVFVVRDLRDGRVAASGTDTMPLPPAPSPGATTGSSAFRVQFEVPPGSYLMRAVVREPGGLVGSADRKLDVRALAGPDVAVSDVILGAAGTALPVRAHAYVEDGLSGTIETYGRSPEQLQRLAVTATLVAADGGSPVQTVRGEIGPTIEARPGVARRAVFTFPLTHVAPGPYTATVKISDGTEAVADVSRGVDVSAGTAPVATAEAAAFRPADILNGDFVKGVRTTLSRSTSPAAQRAAEGFDAFARGDYAVAADRLTASMHLEQGNAAVAFVLGWAWEAQGNHRQAIGAWRAAAAANPQMVPAHLALADAYLRIAQPALAVQALRAGLQALPDSPELRARLAEIEKTR
jgi:VWFA-related protein